METGQSETADRVMMIDGVRRVFAVTKSAYRDHTGAVAGVCGVVREVTSQRNAESALQQQNQILQQIALGVPLRDVLEQMAALIESEIPSSVCGILLVDRDARHLRVGASGALPGEYNEIVDGIILDPEIGPCPTVAVTGQSLAVEDIARLDKWPVFKKLALDSGLRACFTLPIMSGCRDTPSVLGTVAVYFKEPTKVDARISELVDRIKHLASIAIESNRVDQDLRTSEARFRSFVDNTTDAFFMLDETGIIVDCSYRACEYLGYSRKELIGGTPDFFDKATDPQQTWPLLAERNSGSQSSFESVHQHKDGTLVPVDIRLVNFESDGRHFFIGTVRDITDQKEAESKLQSSHQQLTSIYETVGDIIFLLSVEPGGCYTFASVNKAFSRVTGFTSEEVIGRQVEQIWPAATVATMLEKYQQAESTQQIVRWDQSATFATGIVVGNASASPVFNDNSVCTHLVVSVHDVTERMRAEAIIQASEERYRSLVESIAEGVLLITANGNIVTCNESAERILGLDSYTICGTKYSDKIWRFVREDGTPFPVEEHPAAVTLQTGNRVTDMVMGAHLPNGEIAWLRFNSEPLRQHGESLPYQVVCSFSDFTAGKIAQDLLKESERRLAESQHIARLGSWTSDPLTGEVWWSEALFEIFGLDATVQQPSAEAFFDLVHPEDRSKAISRSISIRAGIPEVATDLRIVRPDGKVVWIHSRAKSTIDASGQTVLIEGTDQDITERKRVEQQLTESQNYSQAIIQATPECIKLVKRNGDLIEMNATGLAMIGADSFDLVAGSSVFDLVVPEHREAYIHFHNQVCNGEYGTHEFDITRLSGQRCSMESQAVPMDIGSERVMLAVTRDVTKRNLAEVALRESEERLRIALQAASAIAFVWDIETDTVKRYYSTEPTLPQNIECPESVEDVKARVHADDLELFEENVATCLKSGTEYKSLYRISRADGTVAWMEEWGNLVRGPDGRPQRLSGISIDVTERKRAEEELRRTSTLLQAVADGISDVVYVKDQDGRYIFCNKTASKHVSLPAEEVLGKTADELFDVQSAQRIRNRDQQIMELKTLQTVEETLTSNGVERTYLSTKAPYYGEKGEVAGVLGISHDITQRKAAERALRLTQFGIDNASDSIFWIGEFGKFISVNDGACRNLGYTREELIGKTAADIDPNYEETAGLHELERLKRGHVFHMETQHVRKDGTVMDVEVRGNYLRYEDQGIVCAFARDITNRKRAEKRVATHHAVIEILASAEDLRSAAPLLLKAICETAEWDVGELWVLDQTGERLRCLEHWVVAELVSTEFSQVSRTSTYRLDEGLGGRVWATAQSAWIADICVTKDVYRSQLAKNVGLNSVFAFPIVLGTEVLAVASFFSRQPREPDAGLLRMLESLGIQIGKFIEQKQAEGRLRLFRTLIDHATDFIEVVDPETGRILDVNQRACEAHGYTRDEFLQLTICDLDSQITRTRFHNELVREISSKGSLSLEGRHLRKDGSTFPVEVNANLIHLDRQYIVANVRDISERTLMEQHLRQSQKMDAVGRLAGGVAHDFNNMLTVINGHAELLLALTPKKDNRRDPLQAIYDAGSRAAELTAQLLAFSRKTFVEPQVIDLNAVVISAKRLLSRLIREDIIFNFFGGEKLQPIKADSGQIEQAIVNLVVNARDAMHDGGLLTITTSNLSINMDDAVGTPDMPPGQYVALEISDTGCGMSEEILSKIFEPFYTTKEVGKGTGLGLAVVHGVMTQCGGHVNVFSDVDQGTTFQLLFPVTESVTDKTKSQRSPKSAGGTETLLIVEDEEGVRCIAQRVLENHGYHVLTSASGAAALDIVREYDGTIHLLLTDVVMPGMGGRELAQQLRRQRPDLKIIFMSGHTDETVFDLGLTEAGDSFLQKPFTPGGLVSKVRTMLDV